MKKVTVSYEMTRVYGVIDGNFTDETVERTVGFLLDDAAAAQLGGVHTPYDSNNCTSEERYLLQAIVALSHLSSSYFIATYRIMSMKIEEVDVWCIHPIFPVLRPVALTEYITAMWK